MQRISRDDQLPDDQDGQEEIDRTERAQLIEHHADGTLDAAISTAGMLHGDPVDPAIDARLRQIAARSHAMAERFCDEGLQPAQEPKHMEIPMPEPENDPRGRGHSPDRHHGQGTKNGRHRQQDSHTEARPRTSEEEEYGALRVDPVLKRSLQQQHRQRCSGEERQGGDDQSIAEADRMRGRTLQADDGERIEVRIIEQGGLLRIQILRETEEQSVLDVG
ncbi:hypothetical protein AL346_22130 (plasmid) [Chelatococcus sp. CO-6]|nr:hypothetical protein AL346_22130 [Chelatococcus sp. CO-6]